MIRCFPLLLAVLFFSCNSHQKNCSDFKTGVFRIKAYENIPVYTIVRKDSMQYETNEQNHTIAVEKITWLSDCKYRLDYHGRTLNGDLASDDTLSETMKELIKIPTFITIISAEKDYCVFEIEGKLGSHSIRDTMWRVQQ